MHLKKGLGLEAPESPKYTLMGKKGRHLTNVGFSSGGGVGQSI